ncbi:MAG TPA: PQQ-dependent sugar dehydrogenase, partial [Candidatus Polarisedimenticolaceae bacterium]|nr:PQQ-dependent sugar dehydrogenase [Candidatus Polarisedimenticolaceae bacterium]
MRTEIKGRALPMFLLASLLAASPGRAAIVAGEPWTETSWFTSPVFSVITGMAWAPDGSGRLFVTEKAGTVLIVNFGPPPTLAATPFATITPIQTTSECGLLGLAFDPDFANNGFVYFFVSVSSSEQQIIRYTDSGGVGIAKTTIVSGLPTAGGNHDGGAVAFGRDGKLYWGVGDNEMRLGVDLDLNSLGCKIGRANRDGSVPADNPFNDGAGPNNDRIFARGTRNTFKATFQRSTGTLWADIPGDLYEQIFAINAGENAGYDDFENDQPAPGPPNFYITPKITYRTNATDTRAILAGTGASRSGNVSTFTTTATHGFRQGAKITIAGVAHPSFNGAVFIASTPTATTFTAAQAGPDVTSGGGTAQTQNLGGAVTGGTFFDSTGAPAAYRGNYFWGDWNSGRIMRAVVGPGTTVQSVDSFATDNTNAIDISVGPDGALYYLGHTTTIRRAGYNHTAQEIIVSSSHVWMDEGGKAVFTVSLATAPASNVTVTTARTSGSTLINLLSGASLTFTPVNFSVPQAVTVQADPASGTDGARFSVASVGLPTQVVEVNSMNAPIVGFESP